DRGSQYAAEPYRKRLEKHGLKGSMGRRGNPYDNAKAESFMEALEHEEVHPNGYETFQDVVARLPRLPRGGVQRQAAALRARLLEPGAVRGDQHPRGRLISTAPLSKLRGSV
ncbi:MAG TPA: hypothetical protein VFY87_32020, partial [Geminicoccaceae bacterium]|nr:hypothetical protein [Geminicoccaceae bacterium]